MSKQYKTGNVTHDYDHALEVRQYDSLRRANDNLYAYPKCSEDNFSASKLVVTGAGELIGIIINSHTSGTIKIWDSLTATGSVVCETITLAAGERWIPLFGASFGTGCYVTIGGTSANITVLFNPADV